MSVKVIIRNTPPNFYALAARAAKKLAIQTEHDSFIIEYEDGPTFWVKRTKVGNISVSGENTK